MRAHECDGYLPILLVPNLAYGQYTCDQIHTKIISRCTRVRTSLWLAHSSIRHLHERFPQHALLHEFPLQSRDPGGIFFVVSLICQTTRRIDYQVSDL